MRFIDECQKVVSEELHQCCRRFSDVAIAQIHRIILDTVHISCLGEHLEVIINSHLDTLRLDEFAMFCEEFHLFFHLVLYFWDHGLDDSLLGDKMLRRKYHNLIQIIHKVVREVLDTRDPLESISEKLEPNDRLTRTRPDLQGISLHEEHTRFPVSG